MFKEKGLSIPNDSTKEERDEYKKMKEIKDQLYQLGIDSKIIKRKLTFNNKTYNVEEASIFLINKQHKKKKTTEKKKQDVLVIRLALHQIIQLSLKKGRKIIHQMIAEKRNQNFLITGQ